MSEPFAGVKVHADYSSDLRVSCDVLIVGTGPGGAVVGKVLAEAGRDVLFVEEGPPFASKDFVPEAGGTLHRMVRESGMRATRGNVFMPTMQAVGLGGGSLVNSAICLRSPDWVFDKWAERTGTTSITLDALKKNYERVEAFWGIEETPAAVMGQRNNLFKKGCDALGIPSEPIRRNVKNCAGSAECFTGCRNGAKQSMDRSWIPAAMKAGARVLTSVRAEQLVYSGKRAVGMRGHVVAPYSLQPSHRVEIQANTVVLAAGCMATPVILQKSDVPDRGGYLGGELQFHPGLAIMGVYPDPVYPWQGATQGYQSLHFLKEGLKLEVLWAPPAVLATRFPGVGAEFKRNLMNYDHMAPFDVIVAADHSRGRVLARRHSWEPDLRYNVDDRDMVTIMRGLSLLSDIAWASGATEVWPALHGLPERLHSKEEAEILRTAKVDARAAVPASNHAFGSTRMAKRAEDGAVDEWGRMFAIDNVYIADTGIFPGSPAVNPMLTLMALADRIALGILDAS